MPATRYQGSKRRSADWILERLGDLEFHTVLDAFSGTGSVAYAFKRAGNAVTCNDVLAFNEQIGLALIENSAVRLTSDEIEAMFVPTMGYAYDDLIARTFEGVYFIAEENRWLDVVAQNLMKVTCRFRRALGLFALYQAALAKRPYNLFHRRNLTMRTKDVPRTFGNKTTWDRPFSIHFRRAAEQANAAVFDNGQRCRAMVGDVLDVDGTFDLVYLDPPYMGRKGVGVDYQHYYHFLEGLTDYSNWPPRIDRESPHKRMHRVPSPWTTRSEIHQAIRRVFERFSHSILAISYRSDGDPSIDELADMLRRVKGRVTCHTRSPASYALSKSRTTCEVLLVGSGNRPRSAR